MTIVREQVDIISKQGCDIAVLKQRLGIDVSAANEPLDSIKTSNVITVVHADCVQQTGVFFADPLAANMIDNSAFEFQEFSDQ